MSDAKFLFWIMQRLIKVHGDSEHANFICKLRAIIENTPVYQVTLNVTKLDMNELRKKIEG
jgi:hypothetical protein